MTINVTILDYGVGNLLSVQRAFEYLGFNSVITADPKVILSSSHVVFPGVGAFPSAMQKLASTGLDNVVKEVANSGTPLMAICLGMQLLMEKSEEFENTIGLGLIKGHVESIPQLSSSGENLKIPHIGWNSLQTGSSVKNWSKSVLEENEAGDFVYFIHSFMVKTREATETIAETSYGGHKIAAVIRKGNITGCQFHPEKSGENGLKILKSFIS